MNRQQPRQQNKLPISNNHGMAVLLALTVILVLVTAGLELHRQTRAALFSAARARDRASLQEMNAAGIQAAMAMLINDRLDNDTDSLHEDWADADAVAAMVEQLAFDQGKVSVQITDETSKIQINALVDFPEGRQFDPSQYRLWERFADRLLSLYDDLEGTDVNTILNSVKDWLDSGDDDAITGLSGAESSYYQDLDPPYECKNAPFDHLSEVRLVKGVLPELFDGLGGAMGMAPYITVYGVAEDDDGRFVYPGKININTAQLPVLAAMMPPDNEEFAQALIDYRDEQSNGVFTHELTRVDWYKNVPGFAGIDLDGELITVTSDTFRIEATAKLNDAQATTTAVIKREKDDVTGIWHCRVLNWMAN